MKVKINKVTLDIILSVIYLKMDLQTVPIHRTNASSTTTNNKNDIWFNAFDFAPGQDEHIRWLSRPNQQLIHDKYANDIEKCRITFDVENFQPEQIKVRKKNDFNRISILLHFFRSIFKIIN